MGVAVSKTCQDCGRSFEAKRSSAKYCGERCRKRAQRRPAGAKGAEILERPAGTASESSDDPVGGVVAATAAELERAGRLETALGRAVMVLARRIDASSAETGSGLATMVREHRAALAEAVKDAEQTADPLDELRSRRERKRASG